MLSESPAGFIYKRSASELPPDMRLSDQSACLVPICLSYSLFIYFHPDMQGIPDKMASLAYHNRAGCSSYYSIDRLPVNVSSCGHELRLPAYRAKKQAHRLSRRRILLTSQSQINILSTQTCPHPVRQISFTPVMTVPDIFPWQNIDLRRACRILSAKSLYTVH